MTNEEIILKSVQAHLTPAQRHEIAAAAYTPEQIAHTVEHIPDGLDELAAAQIHTFGFWKQNGKSVKRGEKALFTCPLWKYTDKPSKAQRDAAEAAGEEAKAHPHYYPTTSYMFSCLQVESSKPAPAGRFSSTAEIIAYNKKLAAERKAAKEAAAKAAEQPTTEPTPEIIPASVADKKPGGWKKCSFYAICTTPQNPPSHAEKRDGYTDGVFNYYALRLGKAAIWYAVHPSYGVSIGPGQNSRSAAKTAAFELLESVAKTEKAPNERLKNCAAMVAAAQNA